MNDTSSGPLTQPPQPYGPRTIWVYGVGGVGGYFGGKIAHAIEQMRLFEKRVFFIARGRHLEEIQKNGLTLNTSGQGAIVCRPERATDSIEGLPAPDLCLVCVKSYDLPDVVRALIRRIKDETVVMPLLNGVDICERIRDILDKGIVLPACVYVGTHIEEPGVVSQKGGDGIILCGADPQRPGFVPGPFIHFFEEVGIRLEWREDPYKAIWEKYLFIASFGLVTVLSGKTLGGVFADEALRALVRGIMNEIVAIARKKGVDLAEDAIAVSLARAGNFPFEAKTSFQRDVETRGVRNEGDLFGGTIIRMGGALGIDTPITQSVYERIQKLRLE